MKKILITACCLCCLTAGAQYKTMKFQTLDGKEFFAGLNQLEITFSDGNLVAHWDAASGSLTLPLDLLKSMEFSASEAGVEAFAASDSEIEVVGIDGVARGVFTSLKDAVENLPAGVYVAKDKEGETLKFSVK